MSTENLSLPSNHDEAIGNSCNDHVIVAVDDDLLSLLEERIKEVPRLLKKSASKETCCIFRVPQRLAEINVKAYHPHTVSIGPYHHGKKHLKMIQEHKGRLLGNLLDRTRKHGVGLKHLIQAVASMEERIRECYCEAIKCNSHELIEMMVLDGCFIIELFCVVGGLVPDINLYDDDPIFKMDWVFFYLVRDLLRLENQIPFFVLEKLFELSVLPSGGDSVPSLVKLALGCFNHALPRPTKVLERNNNIQGKHLLDLFRLTLLPSTQETTGNNISPSLQLIQSAENLYIAGVRFKPGKAHSVLDIKFNRGVLEIPTLKIDDFTSSMFLNCVAYEQCYRYCSKHIISYVVFMGCLINTPTDAGFLCDHNIIENYFGTNEEVTRFFHDVGKDVAFDIQRSYLLKLFEDVNKYYNNDWHVQWAEFKHTYFASPWSFMSAVAAIAILIFSLVQAFFAMYAYISPPV